MERSTFIVALVVAHHILSYTKPLSLALQNSKCDVYEAFVDAQNCKKVIAAQRSDTVFLIILNVQKDSLLYNWN
jgi:hypothetical protein